jgi:hypothetical protein
MENLFLSVLDKKRKDLLNKLGFLKDYGFYLAGGTSLALQIGHRTSLDFDFYTKKEFEPPRLREEFDKRFKKVREIHVAEGTLILDIEGIELSFFKYPYKLVKPCLKLEDVNLASVEDIAAMKILAISQRGKRRDFIGIYFLIQKFGLKKIMELTKEKYSMFNIYVGLQGLSYFKDADEDLEVDRFRLFEKISWGKIKNYIVKEVSEERFQL